MYTLILILKLILSPIGLCYNWLDSCAVARKPRPHPFFPNKAANASEGTHTGRLTRILGVNAAKRGLLVKTGAVPNQVVICDAHSMPQGMVLSGGNAGDAVAVALIGAADSTFLMVSATPIKEGEEVFTAAEGRIQGYPTEKGTYYRVGQALGFARRPGEVIEVDPYAPLSINIS